MQQYAVYTMDPNFLEVVKWINLHKLKYEPHLNRTRFWIPEGPMLVEFLLKWQEQCPKVEESNNYALR